MALGERWIEQQPEDSPKCQRRKDYARASLKRIEQKPWSRYKATDHSLRLFVDGCGLATLLRELRKILLGGCYERALGRQAVRAFAIIRWL